MPRHIDAWMDGVALSSIGSFLIKQVSENAPTVSVMSSDRPGRYGQIITSRKRQSLKVVLEVVILELHDLARRARLTEQLAAWAGGSVLELSNHRDRRLHVVCTGVPTVGNARDYNTAIRIEWTAFAVPYWENMTANTATISGRTGTGTLWIDGTEQTPVDMMVTVEDGTLTNFLVTAAGQRIELKNLNVQKGSELTFSRDDRDDLLIRSGSEGLLSHRTAESADDLMTTPGSAYVEFTANTACRVTFSARGRWS